MLKQLIQRLLDSRTTPAGASHNAMPDDASISLTPSVTEPSTWQEVLTATTPTDGYVKIQATSTTSVGFIAIMQTPEENRCAASMTGTTSQTPMATLPVAKGSTFKVFGDGVKNLTVKIIPSIGGGYKALKDFILQGGGLCLNSLSSSLRRSSLPTRSLGFTKIPSLLRTLLSRCSQARQGFQNGTTQRRLTVWPLSLLEKPQPRTFLVSWRSTVSGGNNSITLSKDGKLTRLFTFLRATFSAWQQEAVIRRSVSSCSIPHRNLSIGGASC